MSINPHPPNCSVLKIVPTDNEATSIFPSWLCGCLLALSFAYVTPTVQAQQASPRRNQAVLQDKISQADNAISEQNSAKAIELLSEVISEKPEYATAWYMRGREHFKSNRIEKAMVDFDRYVKLNPQRSSSQWERGICLFYAGRYQEGADQFDAYQTFHNADVENGVWKFLCTCKAENIEKARETMLEIEGDGRVPMAEIYELYRGKIEPAEVVGTVRRNDPRGPERVRQWFYAHLYIGLYEEARGNAEAAEANLKKAVGFKIDHYMWNVADVHVKRMYPAELDKPAGNEADSDSDN